MIILSTWLIIPEVTRINNMIQEYLGVFKLIIINMEGIAFEALIEGKQKVYVSKHSPLAILGTITPHDILDQTLVTYKGEFMPN